MNNENKSLASIKQNSMNMPENMVFIESRLRKIFDESQLLEFARVCETVLSAGGGFGAVEVVFRASRPTEIDGRFSVRLNPNKEMDL